MKTEQLAGCVAYAQAKDGLHLALVRAHERWILPRGHIEEGEGEAACAARETSEELGLELHEVTLKGKIGSPHPYISHVPSGSDGKIQKVMKMVTYFLAEIPYKELKCPKKGGVKEARWFTLLEVSNLETHKQTQQVILKAVNTLLEAGFNI